MPIDQYIRLKRLAKLLDVHPKTVMRWVAQSKFLRPVYVGGEPRWKEMDVLLYLEKTKTDPPPEEISPSEGGAEGDRREHLGTSAAAKPKRG